MASNQKQIDRTTANEYKGHAGIRIKIFSFIIVWCTTLKEQNETNHVWISEPEKNSRRRKKQIRWKLNQIESNGMSNAECLCDCWGSGSGWHLISRYGRTQFMQSDFFYWSSSVQRGPHKWIIYVYITQTAEMIATAVYSIWFEFRPFFHFTFLIESHYVETKNDF